MSTCVIDALVIKSGCCADDGRQRDPGGPILRGTSSRTCSVAASATDCVYARVSAAPQASAEPLNLSILVPAARTRPLAGRIQVTTRELNAKHADHRVRSGRLATSLQPAPISKVQIVSDSDPFRSGLRRSRPPSSRSSAAHSQTASSAKFRLANFRRSIQGHQACIQLPYDQSNWQKTPPSIIIA
jgi:hypothetical protein